MWLRRQDELNEARPTERFSTAIRLLSGRAAMERKYAKAREEAEPQSEPDLAQGQEPAPEADPEPDVPVESVDVRALAVPATEVKAVVAKPQPQSQASPHPHPHAKAQQKPQRPVPANTARAKVLARRRRTTTLLFLGFTAGMIVAAVGGLAFLWAPGVPAVLLSLYIAHLRRQERRRFEVKLDQRRATEAAQRLRDRRRPAEDTAARPHRKPAVPASPPHRKPVVPTPAPVPVAEEPATADRRALVEQTDHAEWVDQQREQRATPADEPWAPAPVPRPTFVTAPVAPRRPADRSRTPLFDQHAASGLDDLDRPRAANE
jgi:hypothetical protein